MFNGQDILVAIVVVGALLMIGREIRNGLRSGCDSGGCGCGRKARLPDDRMGTRRELLQVGLPKPANGSESDPRVAPPAPM